jgi:TNF receptor-associated factor 2/TNF receptor-associated factor 3
LLDDAVSGGRKSIYSPPFYLFPNGYKICLRLYINGDRKARDTHISLFFIIMRGDYDDKLQWPFKFKTTFSLIDQSITNDHQYHISKFCWPDSTATCFDRPNSDMNNGFGIPMCFPLACFEQNLNQYVHNDRIYIMIEIDLLTEKPSKQCISKDHLVLFFFCFSFAINRWWR